MAQVWTMRTFNDKMANNDPSQVWTDLIATLDDEGFTSVVATDSDFEFFTELRPGDRVSLTEVIESISEEKQTGLGVGHFVTTLKTYRRGGAATHAAMYLVTFAIGASGFATGAQSAWPDYLGGALAEAPALESLASREVHEVLAIALLGLVALHVGGVMLQQARKGGVLRRMLPL